ncbi:MAG TPA: hypothetical protein VH988_13545 [Thermoanaerobaculia bacterium]|jgi:hypothetical protein|nr:hypothetical protein [Thermoanaerobaculia bacterium]
MCHKRRVFCVETVSTVEELAEQLIGYTWCLCAGFQLSNAPDTLFLNDSFSLDGAQEYAVLRLLNGQWFQVDSITFGWIKSLDKACRCIRDAVSGPCDPYAPSWGSAAPRFHQPDQRCASCQ